MSVLQHLALSSPLSYLAAFLIPMLDAILPVLPSETIVIALGVSTAGSTDPRIALLVGLAACGAFAGDNLCYFIGRRFGPLAERKLFAGEKGARRRAWATGALDRFGARLIVVCRFIPGGRTAVTLTCGIVGYSRRSFLIATAFAGVIWACYAFFLGRLGGKAFEDRPWIGFLLAFGVALAASAIIELVRRVKPWRWFRRRGPEGPPGPAGPPAGDQDVAQDPDVTRTNRSG
ncbi:MAG TPA: DedA family protein [Streptosporangiaceae bacterium]|nr:DedA family protein [Streptosporangiaceae bacterium]